MKALPGDFLGSPRAWVSSTEERSAARTRSRDWRQRGGKGRAGDTVTFVSPRLDPASELGKDGQRRPCLLLDVRRKNPALSSKKIKLKKKTKNEVTLKVTVAALRWQKSSPFPARPQGRAGPGLGMGCGEVFWEALGSSGMAVGRDVGCGMWGWGGWGGGIGIGEGREGMRGFPPCARPPPLFFSCCSLISG